MRKKIALVLSGGGARGSYQAGAVRAIYEIIKEDQLLFPIITGNSVGALNAAYLASNSRDWGSATQYLFDLWSRVKPYDVFDLSAFEMSKIGTTLIKETIFKSRSELGFRGFLNTAPLKSMILREIDFKEIKRLIDEKLIYALAFATTNYYSGSNVIFFDGDSSIQSWHRRDLISIRSSLNASHVIASSAIPLFFPPEKIDQSFYGDGCIRLVTPLSPAIHLGAEKIITIGIRNQRSVEQIEQIIQTKTPSPHLGKIVSVMMSAIFLDALEADVDRLQRVNELVISQAGVNAQKNIPLLPLIPSSDLSEISAKVESELPIMLRYFLQSLGIQGKSGEELLSYLAFDQSYTSQVCQLGYEDTMKRKKEILNFFED